MRALVFVSVVACALLGLTAPAIAAPAIAAPAIAAPATTQAELTGYSFFDNTPPSSADICCPVLHRKAGGMGTFADPITTAVPGSGGREMQTPKGTRLYVPKLRRYFIVEDSGATPKSLRRFDLWVDGKGFSRRSSDLCMDDVTGKATVILNPAAGLPVTVGPLTGRNGCVI